MAAPLSPVAVALLDQRIEGWIAGLRLASLSLRDAADAETEVAGLSGSNVEIADYLMDQVVSRQTPAILRFLLVTSSPGPVLRPAVRMRPRRRGPQPAAMAASASTYMPASSGWSAPTSL